MFIVAVVRIPDRTDVSAKYENMIPRANDAPDGIGESAKDPQKVNPLGGSAVGDGVAVYVYVRSRKAGG